MERRFILLLLFLLQTGSALVFSSVKNEDARPEYDPFAHKFDYFFAEAVRQRLAGHPDQAADLLTECYYIDPQSAALAFEFSKVYALVDDEQNALRFAQRALLLEPDNFMYKAAVASNLLRNNDLDGAIGVYENMAEQRKDLDDIDYKLSNLYLQQRRPDKAVEVLNRLEKKNDINEFTSFRKAQIYSAMQDNRRARKELQRLSKKYPNNYDYKLALAQSFIYEGDMTQAQKVLDEVRVMDPHNESLFPTQTELYRAKGDSALADSMLTQAMLDSSLTLMQKTGYLQQYLATPNASIHTTETSLKRLLRQYPNDEMTHQTYVTLLMMQKKYDESLREFQEIVRINPQNVTAWASIIDIYEYKKDSVNAIRTCDSAQNIMPEEATFVYVKALYAYSHQKRDEAKGLFKKCIELSRPEQKASIKAEAEMLLGDIYATEQDYATAFGYYEDSYQSNPHNPLMLNNYAYFLAVRKEQLAKAEKMSGAALQYDPNNISFLDTYAWVFFVQENFVMAELYIKQAVDKGGADNEVIAEHYGDILSKIGKQEEAIQWWKKSYDMGNRSTLLEKKIKTGVYHEE